MGRRKKLASLQRETLGRYVHRVDVQRAIDLALGIFRFRCLGKQWTVVLAADDMISYENAPYLCFAKPSFHRLLTVRRNLTHLTGGEVGNNQIYGLAQTSLFEFEDLFLKDELWKTPLNADFSLTGKRFLDPKERVHTALGIAVAIANLQPWCLQVVVPRSLVDVLCGLLTKPFLRTPPTEGLMLYDKMFELRHTTSLEIPGWTWSTLHTSLKNLESIATQHFSGLSSRCSLYYDSMVSLFKKHAIEMHSVSMGLAAWCVASYLDLESFRVINEHYSDEWHAELRAGLM